jgi:hypothetical protein
LESITTDSNEAAGAWVLKVLQILQPEAVKADLLSSMQLFGGLRWPELEVAGAQFDEVAVSRGARLTVQGRADARLCVLISGEALVSADARPEQFRELIRQATIRRRLTALAADQLRRGRPFRGR